MADIELVVKIEEERYNQIKRCADNYLVSGLELAVKNGIPLPKGHGDLIDRTVHLIDGKFVCDAKIIIEADKEDTDE